MKQYFDEHMKTHTGESLSGRTADDFQGCVGVKSQMTNITVHSGSSIITKGRDSV